MSAQLVVAVGYNECERHDLPLFLPQTKEFTHNNKCTQTDPTFKIKSVRLMSKRPVVAAALGCHVPGACLPHPNPSDTHTIIAGSAFRFGRLVPRGTKWSARFEDFVDKWLINNLKPLSIDTDTSFDAWIVNTPYTLARKQELKQKLQESNLTLGSQIPDKFLKVKSFMKDEHYPSFKHGRAINSRHDVFKALVGPIFQLVSNEVFKNPAFIKKIPVPERPQYILDRMMRMSVVYILGDASSYEASFVKALMDQCEMKLIKYMTQHLAEQKFFIDLLDRAKTSVNQLDFKLFSMTIEAKRMSGEMDTSLSNGFTTLMIVLFVLIEMCGLKEEEVRPVVEGDDNEAAVEESRLPNKEHFAELGMDIKLEIQTELSHASFCGMVFDLDEKTNITDPIAELVSFGWTTSRYAKSRKGVHMCLLRAKALSLAYQYPACPILSKLAYKIALLTKSYDSLGFLQSQGNHAFNLYEMEMMIKAHEYFQKNNLLNEPGPKTRRLVEDLYGVPVSHQLQIEEYILSLKSITPLDHPLIRIHIKPEWHQYYDAYVFNYHRSQDFNNVAINWPEARDKFQYEVLLKKNATVGNL